MFLILFPFLFYFINSHTVLSNCYKGRISQYSDAESELASCSLSNEIGDGYFKTAASEYFYKEANMCGTCYELVGELGSVKVQITDRCPAKGSNNCNVTDFTHFDLTTPAFPYLCRMELGVSE
ncbi:MAG: hypothetical protein MJ252_14725 [archaeon]|nr:hypothetical protein [archaeon]